MKPRRLLAVLSALAATLALAPQATARITIEAGATQRVEIQLPPDVPREVRLVATVEVPAHLRDQVRIDVLPRELVLRPGQSPGAHLKIESDACSPSLFFRARLILRSPRAVTVTPLTFWVEDSPIECWGPVALTSLLVALLLYAVWSWIVNLRLFNPGSLDQVDSRPRGSMDHCRSLRAAIRDALQPRERVRAWLRSGAWWRSLLGIPYRETLRIVPNPRAPSATVVPRGSREGDDSIFLEAAWGDMRIHVPRSVPWGFRVVVPRPRRVDLIPKGNSEAPGWRFRGTLQQ